MERLDYILHGVTFRALYPVRSVRDPARLSAAPSARHHGHRWRCTLCGRTFKDANWAGPMPTHARRAHPEAEAEAEAQS